MFTLIIPVRFSKITLKKVRCIWIDTGQYFFRTQSNSLMQSNFIEITLLHGCSPANLLHIFRRSFPRSTSGWLLLTIDGIMIITIKVIWFKITIIKDWKVNYKFQTKKTRLISETKIDFSFPTVQFQIEGCTTYRLDRNANSEGILLLIWEDIPSSLKCLLKVFILRWK